MVSTGAVTVASLNAASADFSGVEGDLTISGDYRGVAEVTGGSGKNTIFAPTTWYEASFWATAGGAGMDTLMPKLLDLRQTALPLSWVPATTC